MFNKFYQGISRSKYDQTGFDDLVNTDIHSEIGSATCQYAMELDSAMPNEKSVSVALEDGTVYFFSIESGKIWRRTAAGAYAFVWTNLEGANISARYYNGYIYYTSNLKLGRIAVANATSETPWTSHDDDWASFALGNIYQHPMEEVNLTLFIGDAYNIASVNSSGTFNNSALDLPKNHVATSLAIDGTNLLIGTILNYSLPQSKVFSWDTYSDSWIIDDSVDEDGVHCFISADNMLFAQCGTEGNIYYWTGSRMEKFKQIRDISIDIGSQRSAVFKGKSFIGIGDTVYSLNRQDKDLPYALNKEYTVTGDEIWSLVASNGNLLVAHDEGVDKIGTDKATATIITPEVEGEFSTVEVKYDLLPDDTSISIWTKIDGGSWTEQTSIVDTVNKKVYFDGGAGNINYVQAKVILNPDGADAPIIKSIEIK